MASYTATWTDTRSNTTKTSPAFGTPELAMGYARNQPKSKDHRLVTGNAAACATVTACDEGTADKQRAAAKAFYAPIKEARRGVIVKDEPRSRENQAELDMETYGAARAAGLSSDAAMDEVNYVNGHG